MKKTTVCFTRVRSLFVCRSGRTSSMEAPVVPTKDARTPPSARKPVLVAGVAHEVAAQQDAARDDEEPGQQHDERDVVLGGVQERRRMTDAVDASTGSPSAAETINLLRFDSHQCGHPERADGDGQQHGHERQHAVERRSVQNVVLAALRMGPDRIIGPASIRPRRAPSATAEPRTS